MAATDGGPMTPAPDCDPNADFTTPTLVNFGNFTAQWLAGLRLSPDELTGYFFTDPAPAGQSDLYSGTRQQRDLPFTNIAPLGDGAINTPAFEWDPTVRDDGLLLVFFRRPAPVDAQSHILFATRSSVNEPFALQGTMPNLEDPTTRNTAPFLRQDGKVLYFETDTGYGTLHQIFRSSLEGETFGPPEPVAELNTPFGEGYPVVTPDDLVIYFGSNRPDGDAGSDSDSDGDADAAATPVNARIWTASRADPSARFGPARRVSAIDFPDRQVHPTFISADRCRLYFFTYVVTADAPYGIMTEYVAERPPP